MSSYRQIQYANLNYSHAKRTDALGQVKDFYEKPEILFCGPDENTADLMEWACLHAKKRGYPYWKAFTTGKPQSLGGIPHDLYGMTTNSVHQFVVETLHDHNLKVGDFVLNLVK